MQKVKKKSNNLILFIVIVFLFGWITYRALDNSTKTKDELSTNKQLEIRPTEGLCETEKNLLFKYKVQNSDIERDVLNLNYKEYIHVDTLEDYFFANGESKSAGGYRWEITQIDNSDECQIKVILYDEETDEKVNPIWNIKGTEIKCDNSGAFEITPELGFSE